MKYMLFMLFILFTLAYSKAQKGEVIANIPEASGIAYDAQNHRLIVVNDEGTYYEITPEGRVTLKKKLGKYDLEGVAVEDDTLIFAIENKGLLLVNKKTGKKKKVIIDTIYKGKKLPLFSKKSGVEGIARVGDFFYLSKQSKKKKDSFIAVVKLKPYPSRVVDVIKHKIPDTAGLTHHDGFLYMVSDKKNLLIQYHLEKRKIIKKIKLEKGAWEGIAFDDKSNLYLADDNGRVVKYKKKALGL
ncbi:MAG: SdiA-regulated domain-containing protein [Campylobacterota bacterium]|nr:SdiA-regulated domain-containing protein [Campylobacterota bacterium]